MAVTVTGTKATALPACTPMFVVPALRALTVNFPLAACAATMVLSETATVTDWSASAGRTFTSRVPFSPTPRVNELGVT